jgi:hypothetical protein
MTIDLKDHVSGQAFYLFARLLEVREKDTMVYSISENAYI